MFIRLIMWGGGIGKRIALQILTGIEYQGKVVDDTENQGEKLCPWLHVWCKSTPSQFPH